jgi:hypothetical protein
MRMILFGVLLIACLLWALARGGAPERAGALLLVAGSMLTVAVNSPLSERYANVELGILVVDVAVLAGFLTLALFTDRYWPLWTTSLQILVVLAHLAKLGDPEMMRNGYGFLIAAWSYPQLLAIFLGTSAHHRNKKERAAAAY